MNLNGVGELYWRTSTILEGSERERLSLCVLFLDPGYGGDHRRAKLDPVGRSGRARNFIALVIAGTRNRGGNGPGMPLTSIIC